MPDPAFVQSATVAGGGGASPLGVAFAGDNVASNMIVVVAAANNGTANIGVTDSQGNAYIPGPKIVTPDNSYEAQLFYARNIKAGPNTVTMTQDGSGGTDLFIYEFSAVQTLESSASATGTGNVEDSGPLTTTNDNDLLFGFFAGTSVAAASDAAGVGWTGTVRSGGTVAISSEYRTPGAIGTYNATFTSTASGKGAINNWACAIVAFNNNAAPAVPKNYYGSALGVVGV